MSDLIDRFGYCPNCKTNWRGPDIYQALATLSCNQGKSISELKKLAAEYGWTEHNKTWFTKLITHETNDTILLECPNMTCQHVFDKNTGIEYASMFDYKRGNSLNKQKEAYALMTMQLNPNDFIVKETTLNPSEIVERFEKETKLHISTPEQRLKIEMGQTDEDCPFEPD